VSDGNASIIHMHTNQIHVRFDAGSDLSNKQRQIDSRNNVVVLFRTLKVQSFILTEVSDCGLLIVVTGVWSAAACSRTKREADDEESAAARV